MSMVKIWSREYSFWYGCAALYALRECIKEEVGRTAMVRGELHQGWFTVFCDEESRQSLLDFLDEKILHEPEYIRKKIEECVASGEELVLFARSLEIKHTLQENLSLFQDYFDRYTLYCTHLWRTFLLTERSEMLFEGILRKQFGNEYAEALYFFSQIQGTTALSAITDYFRTHQDEEMRVEYIRKNYPWIGSRDPFQEPLTIKEIKEFVAAFRLSGSHHSEVFVLSEKILVENYQRLLWIKDRRDELRREAFYHAFPLVKEISQLVGISVEKLGYLLPQECADNLQKIIHERKEGVRAEISNDVLSFQPFEKKAQEHDASAVLTGSIGCLGKVQGHVQVLRSKEDISSFPSGKILVTHTTDVSHLPAMSRALAFVTDVGGIACHAAIVAREMNLPCIVGTGTATTTLKDGDFVEVDAEKGIVRKLS